MVFGILPVRRIPAATTLHKKPARELNEGKLVLYLVEKIEKQLGGVAWQELDANIR